MRDAGWEKENRGCKKWKLYVVGKYIDSYWEWFNKLSQNLKMLGDAWINKLQHPPGGTLFCPGNTRGTSYESTTRAHMYTANSCTLLHSYVLEKTSTSMGFELMTWLGLSNEYRILLDGLQIIVYGILSNGMDIDNFRWQKLLKKLRPSWKEFKDGWFIGGKWPKKTSLLG